MRLRETIAFFSSGMESSGIGDFICVTRYIILRSRVLAPSFITSRLVFGHVVKCGNKKGIGFLIHFSYVELIEVCSA